MQFGNSKLTIPFADSLYCHWIY